jgi:NAD(P)H dehydrogenase (quinone)
VRAQQAQADIPAVTHDDLRWADGIAWGTPTRYGNMSAQMKQFVDTTGGLWLKGELEDKATGIFTSTASIHGGQETTILTALVPLIHLGMVFVGTPYGQNPQLLVTDGIGGSPYGPGTLAGTDGSRQPVEGETHNRTQPRQSPCSRRGPSQGPQGKSCVRAIAWETIPTTATWTL